MRWLAHSSNAVARANSASVHGSMASVGSRRYATITCAVLRNAANDSQPACSDSGAHAQAVRPGAVIRAVDSLSAQVSRHTNADQMMSNASQNSCCENTGIHTAVSANPAAAQGRIPASGSVAARRENACHAPNTMSHRKIRPQIANA